ncbi:LLM class flavin-dependent oxidoreductase [Pseudomonas typographi]|uniref:LLM class flavin-dependent oxidoreductase n=1 Tax=Pseudomonas typographi TaxID=2715964 RepID=A0ABR7Z1Y4_9PSED|nr:LLM class flavin-dependent oxidoreductase [Pseudomonas typographi]MBD1551511.1 LLM class flavin-dependent oxidoreductase [Pseudomonas typographi]MBD1587503.1 LLM class flavin-dependent oxidoreductase [Pseudomonas typographi]MBD1599414.1 LLM class flavin-dependent oxidoreductase [Pseudomonas typographi]
MSMQTGLIFHPYMKPGRTARQTFDWGVQSAIAADKAGFSSMMISEHASQRWENIPNPELIIAAAALQTETIKFAPMAHILPHQHPAKLAIMIGWLSQILEGRYFLGIGAGAYPQASYIHGIKGGEDTKFLNDMVRESLQIMEKIWKREPFFHEGKFWKAGYPEEERVEEGGDEQHMLADFSPWGGKPDIAVTGFSFNSPSMRLAGERGFKPVSIFSGLDALKSHWDTYSEAAVKAGYTPLRSNHAVSQTVFVADTDKEAKRLVMEGPIGYCFQRYLIPIWWRFGMMDGFIKDKGASAKDVDLEWLVDNVFIVGSPDTVAEKINTLFAKAGGWGTLQVEAHDYVDDPSPWFKSLELISREVAPKIKLPK